jgi:DNA primase
MNNSTVEQVKQQLDAERFFRDHLKQFKVRGRQASALCPFHEDKSPSLSINLECGLFYCFGCGERGDIFSFHQKLQGVDFKTSLGELARLAGIQDRFQPLMPEQRRLRETRCREVEQELESFLCWLNDLRSLYIEKFQDAAQAEREGRDKARALLAAGKEVDRVTLVIVFSAAADKEWFQGFLEYLDDPDNHRELYLTWKRNQPRRAA